MLKVEGLNQYYGGSHILRDLTFEARQGEVTVVLGRNGVGKTTLLKSLMGVVPIKTGSVQLVGQDITRATSYERVRKGIGAFSWFIYRFTTPAMRWLFKNPKNAFRLEEAIISMLAGDVFDSDAVHRRFRVLRLIYGVRTAIDFKEHLANKTLRKKNARTVFDGVTTPEGQPGTVGFS